VTALVCVLLFLGLTFEDEFFAVGRWNTPLAVVAPLFHGNPIRAWDVVLALLGLVALARRGALRRLNQPSTWAVLVSLFALVALLGWGVLRGGDFRLSYFQIESLLRFFLLFPVLLALLGSRRDLFWLGATVAAAAFYRAAACVVGHRFFVRNVGTEPWPQYITDHHDSVLWVAVVLGLASWVLVRVRPRRVLAAAVLALPLLLAIHYNNRRIAWLELVGGIGLACLALPPGRSRRVASRWAVAALPLVLVYTVLGWTRPESVFAPVRKIKSAVSSEPNDSNMYRDLENASLVVTLQRGRFAGTGLGHPFVQISDRYAGISRGWDKYQYVPHNSLMGLAAYGGVAGFPLVWVFVPVGAFLAARARWLAQRTSDAVLSSVALCFTFVYGVQAFGDMGLQSLKANLLLAVALATATRLTTLTGAWPQGAAARRASPSGPPGRDPAAGRVGAPAQGEAA
jgi:hypothetical protein